MTVVAAATIGSAALGAYSSNKASKQARADANAMRDQGEQAARLGREQFDWYKQEYERTRPEREAATQRANQISDSQFRGMEFAMQQARDADQRNRTVFQPLENAVVDEAKNFDTEAKREELAGQALADTNRAFTSARDQQVRELNASGINPNSGAALAVGQNARVQQALALAGGANRARTQARTEGYARKMDAIGLGKGLVGQQATMMQVANGSGNAAVASAGAGLNATYSGTPMMQQGFGAQMQGIGAKNGMYQTAGNFQNTANNYAGQRDQAFGSMLGTLGQAGSGAWNSLGSALSGFSDENMKKGTGQPADTAKALDEVMAVPVEEGWEYDESKGAPAGLGGKKHIGPMAQNVRKVMGDKAAPRGEILDFVEINGKLMASMQELGKRVQKLEGAMA